MKRLLLLLGLLTPITAQAQVFPLSNGFVCTFLAGSTTPSPTYANSALSTPNPNPIRLNSAGQPTNGSAVISMYIGALSYKVELHAAGTGSSCNGTTVGALVRSADNVYDFGLLNNGQISGSGTLNHIPKFTGASSIGNTANTDDGANFTINDTLVLGGLPTIAHNAVVFANGSKQLATDEGNFNWDSSNKLLYVGFGPMTDFVGDHGILTSGAVGLTVSTANSNASTGNFNVVTGQYVSINAGRTGGGTRLPFVVFTGGAESFRIDTSHNAIFSGLSSITNNAIPIINSSKALTTDEGNLNWDSTKKLLYVGFGPITDGTFTASGGVVATGSGGITVATANTNASTGNFNVVAGQYVSINAGRSSPSGTRLPFVVFTGALRTATFDTSGIYFGYPHTGYGSFTTSADGGAIFGKYGVYSASDTTDGSYLGINTNGSTISDLRSGAVGSGTVLPLGLVVGSTTVGKFATSGTDRTCIYINGSLRLLSISGGAVIDGGACP